MKNNTIKNFVANNWSDIISTGAVIGAEVVIVMIYKNFVKKLECD